MPPSHRLYQAICGDEFMIFVIADSWREAHTLAFDHLFCLTGMSWPEMFDEVKIRAVRNPHNHIVKVFQDKGAYDDPIDWETVGCGLSGSAREDNWIYKTCAPWWSMTAVIEG